MAACLIDGGATSLYVGPKSCSKWLSLSPNPTKLFLHAWLCLCCDDWVFRFKPCLHLKNKRKKINNRRLQEKCNITKLLERLSPSNFVAFLRNDGAFKTGFLHGLVFCFVEVW